jgi:Ser/Thr protein kinase RdoA (MazF antagonist)
MGPTPTDSQETLARALAALGDERFGRGFYTYGSISGGTQAAVWRGTPLSTAHPAIAVRLTPKPLELIRRIATAVDSVRAVECPQTLGTSSIDVDGRALTVQVCTWIGSPAFPKSDMRRLGACLAALHTELQTSSQDFSDRRLSFERAELPAPADTDQELPPWYVARHIWRERIMAWLHLQAQVLPAQPIHGDMHWANIVPTSSGFGFIDFDKVMWAPPVFDLAKLIATGFFEIGTRVRFREQRAAQLLEGYTTQRGLSEKEAAALEGLALLLNEETARIGMLYGVDTYRENAAAVATWWITRRKRRGANPLGIRDLLDPAPATLVTQHQLALWPDPDPAQLLGRQVSTHACGTDRLR